MEAWAAAADDRVAFGRRMLTGRVFLAEEFLAKEADRPIGFGVLCADGHIGALYVRGDCQGRGVGRALLRRILDAAVEAGIDRLHAEASAFSLPLFKRMGFSVVGAEMVERCGVRIERHRVERAVDRTA